jgi:hypothetical protein
MTRLRSCAAGAAAVAAVLLAPSEASAAVTCDVQSGGGLDIRITASNQLAQIERSGEDIVVRTVSGTVPCLDFSLDPVTPTIGGTPVILASSEPGAVNVTFIVDDAAGFSSLPTFVNLRNGASSLLSVRAGDFSGQMVFGVSGIDTDPGSNADLDITANNVPALDGRGGFANPVNFSAQGGGGTGAALTAPIEFLGSAAADVLSGGEGGDFVQALTENDLLLGHGGDDRLLPGAGGDSVDGGAGGDVVDYGDLAVGVSVDLALAGPQSTGGGGNDALSAIENVAGTFLVDVLRGDAGPNRIEGAGGTDILEGRTGVDNLLAGPGNDDVNARDGGPDTVDCGTGDDTATADAAGIDAMTGCEAVSFASPSPQVPEDEIALNPNRSMPQQSLPPSPPGPTALSQLRLAPSTFVALRRGPSARKASLSAAPRGTTVSFRLSTAAPVTFRVARRLPHRRCAGPSLASQPQTPCKRLALLRGSFIRAGQAGANRFRFTGRIGGGALKPGAYQLQATPGTGDAKGALVRAAFRIVR